MDEAYILGVPTKTPHLWVNGTLGKYSYHIVSPSPINKIGVQNLEERFVLPGPFEEYEYYFIEGPKHEHDALGDALKSTKYRLLGPVIFELNKEDRSDPDL